MTKAQNPIYYPQKWLEENSIDYTIFQYPYQFTLLDKIYASKIYDKSLIDLCLKNIEYEAPYNHTLAGDIESEFKVSNLNGIQAIKKELCIHFSRILNKKIDDVDIFNSNLDVNDISLWANFQRPYEFNPSHAHTGFFSFVIYASIPEAIREEHKESRGNQHSRGLIQFQSQLSNERLTFNPEQNTILIFESTHIHQVYPFYSDNTRITIAGNVYGFE